MGPEPSGVAETGDVGVGSWWVLGVGGWKLEVSQVQLKLAVDGRMSKVRGGMLESKGGRIGGIGVAFAPISCDVAVVAVGSNMPALVDGIGSGADLWLHQHQPNILL